MKILAIETSCDETAVAIVEATGSLDKPKFQILAKVVNSQIDIHKEFGGVFPSLAKREHAKNIVPVLTSVISEIHSHTRLSSRKSVHRIIRDTDQNNLSNELDPASPGSVNSLGVRDDIIFKIKEILNREEGLFETTIKFLNEYEKPDVDMIAVTEGPGLEPALWVGINFARALSIAWQIPLLGVNHMEGHMASVLLKNKKTEFPTLALLISGGHTELVEIESWNKYKILGKTRDDAVGESYDKVARLLGFPYPGGPKISQLANDFRKKQIISNIKFPRPMINSEDLDFSFSGLKTAVLYKIRDLTKGGSTSLNERLNLQIAGEFEQAIVDVLIHKLGQALNLNEYKNIIVAGGVVANEYIRSQIANLANNYGIKALFPDLADSTDNAQMIACTGYFKSFKETPQIGLEISAKGGLTY